MIDPIAPCRDPYCDEVVTASRLVNGYCPWCAAALRDHESDADQAAKVSGA